MVPTRKEGHMEDGVITLWNGVEAVYKNWATEL